MTRLIPVHGRIRWMSEAFGRGFYPGPVWMHQTHKTDYDQRKSPWDGNAVWQCLKPTARRESTAVEKQTAPTDAKPESERQGQRAAGVDGKLLTELLDVLQAVYVCL